MFELVLARVPFGMMPPPGRNAHWSNEGQEGGVPLLLALPFDKCRTTHVFSEAKADH